MTEWDEWTAKLEDDGTDMPIWSFPRGDAAELKAKAEAAAELKAKAEAAARPADPEPARGQAAAAIEHPSSPESGCGGRAVGVDGAPAAPAALRGVAFF